VADGLELDQVVGEGEQARAAGEEVRLEIGAQAVAEDGDVELVDDVGGLVHLRGGEELGLVDEDAGDGADAVLALDAAEEVVGVGQDLGRRLEADARAHAAEAGSGVDGGGEDERAHPAFLVVVARLQEDGGFAGVHRRVVEVKLRHGGERLPPRGGALNGFPGAGAKKLSATLRPAKLARIPPS